MLSRKEQIKSTLSLWAFTFLKIPLIWYVRPIAIDHTPQRSEFKIRLARKTKNHLSSMYFGVLVIGSELVVAARAQRSIQESRRRVDFIFKDFSIQCLKRAEGDVHFICEEGEMVDALIAKAIVSGVRETQTFSGYAVVPSRDAQEKVVTFTVTLSVKLRK